MRSFVETFIRDYLAVPENNSLGPQTTGIAWDGFLLGYSSGADELYPFLKDHIGAFHWTPAEAYALGTSTVGSDTTPGGDVADGHPAPPAPEELTVISWALCQTGEAKAANRRETRFPSEPWARSRIYGQRCNRRLHRALAEALTAQGYATVAPGLLPEMGEQVSPGMGGPPTGRSATSPTSRGLAPLDCAAVSSPNAARR